MSKVFIDREKLKEQMPAEIKASECDCDQREWLYMKMKDEMIKAFKTQCLNRFPEQIELSFS